MRLGPDDLFWLVTDAAPDSTLGDICFEMSLRGLERQFRGGLSADRHPTLHTDRRQAEADAQARLLAVRTARAIAERAALAIAAAPGAEALHGAARVQVLDATGAVVFDAPLT